MNRQLVVKLAASIGIGLLLVSTVWARAHTGANLPWQVMAGGGGVAHSAGHTVHYTVGQALTGAAQGAALRLRSGFWYGFVEAAVPGPGMRLYLPAVIKS
jgi:hypothetical protein